MEALFWQQSEIAVELHKMTKDNTSAAHINITHQQWEHAVKVIASLPERMSNQLKLQTKLACSSIFSYIYYVFKAINTYRNCTVKRKHKNEMKTNTKKIIEKVYD